MCLKNLAALRKRSPEDKISEADVLIGEAIKKDRSFVLAHPEYQPNFFERIKIVRFINRLKRGWPIAYITGHKEFYDLDFIVNNRVLVPRPETETIVSLALERLQSMKTGRQPLLIDIGTGSGCIPVSIAKKFGQPLKIIAVDISRSALRAAKKNAKRHSVNIQFFRGDLLKPVNKANIQITNYRSLITANLPYLTREWFGSEPSIQKEPRTALIADDTTGLSLYEKLFKQISELQASIAGHLAADAEQPVNCELLCEIDPRQSDAARKMAKKFFSGAKIEIKKDLSGLDRVLSVKL